MATRCNKVVLGRSLYLFALSVLLLLSLLFENLLSLRGWPGRLRGYFDFERARQMKVSLSTNSIFGCRLNSTVELLLDVGW